MFAIDSIPAIFGVTNDTFNRLHLEYFALSAALDVPLRWRMMHNSATSSEHRAAAGVHRRENAAADVRSSRQVSQRVSLAVIGGCCCWV